MIKTLLWIVDCIIPVAMIVTGLYYRFSPNPGMERNGTDWPSLRRYSSRVWLAIGGSLGALVAAAWLFAPLPEVTISLSCAGLGVLGMTLPMPMVEWRLHRMRRNA